MSEATDSTILLGRGGKKTDRAERWREGGREKMRVQIPSRQYTQCQIAQIFCSANARKSKFCGSP
jgi:hypothetical protein